jgi:hypothetical protein
VRRLFTSILPTVVTALAGLVIFLSFLLPALVNWRAALVNIAVIIAAFAMVLGFVHLILGVHIQRIRHGKGAFYSLVLILSAMLTLGVLIAERLLLAADPTHPVSTFIFNNIITPMQSSLGALLAIFLAVAAFRMLHRRRTAGAVWFLLSALIVLITQVPLPFAINPDGTSANIFGSILNGARNVVDALTVGGMRGLLLGVALGTIATAFRVLFFIDRPQSE